MHKMLKTVSSTQEVLMERALYAIVVVNSNSHDNFFTSKVSYLIHRVGPTEIIAEWCFKYIHYTTRSCHLYSAKQRVSEILTQVSGPLSSNRAVTPNPASIDGISRPKVSRWSHLTWDLLYLRHHGDDPWCLRKEIAQVSCLPHGRYKPKSD